MEDKIILSFGLVFGGTLISSRGMVFFKQISANLKRKPFDLLKERRLHLGILCQVVAAFFYVFALKFGELSTLYPLTGLNYVWVNFFSLKILKEKMNFLKWGGTILILIGVVFIGLS